MHRWNPNCLTEFCRICNVLCGGRKIRTNWRCHLTHPLNTSNNIFFFFTVLEVTIDIKPPKMYYGKSITVKPHPLKWSEGFITECTVLCNGVVGLLYWSVWFLFVFLSLLSSLLHYLLMFYWLVADVWKRGRRSSDSWLTRSKLTKPLASVVVTCGGDQTCCWVAIPHIPTISTFTFTIHS